MYVRAAGPLAVTVLSIAISNIFKLYKAPHNIAIVGVIPRVRTASLPSTLTQTGSPVLFVLMTVAMSVCQSCW